MGPVGRFARARRPMVRKRRVAVLGATGMVGRRFAELLADHPWFTLELLVGSPATAGLRYAEVWEQKEAALVAHYGDCAWRPRPCPPWLDEVRVGTFDDLLASAVDIIFSSVPENAGEYEQALLDAGFLIFSNSPFGRFDPRNPLVVPEVNRGVVTTAPFVKNPNCVTSGLVMILDALRESWGLREVSVTTYQSLSGRGDAKYAKNLVIGNVLPLHGSSENTETYITKEVKKILSMPVPLSVSCNRVGVQEGHYVDVRVKTERRVPDTAAARACLADYNPLRTLGLPSSPEVPLVVLAESGRPRPSDDAGHHGGMAVAIGNLSTDDEVHDVRLSYVVNNLVRGAAGGAILNAETYLRHQADATGTRLPTPYQGVQP